jgi:hypothetical protein
MNDCESVPLIEVSVHFRLIRCRLQVQVARVDKKTFTFNLDPLDFEYTVVISDRSNPVVLQSGKGLAVRMTFSRLITGSLC